MIIKFKSKKKIILTIIVSILTMLTVFILFIVFYIIKDHGSDKLKKNVNINIDIKYSYNQNASSIFEKKYIFSTNWKYISEFLQNQQIYDQRTKKTFPLVKTKNFKIIGLFVLNFLCFESSNNKYTTLNNPNLIINTNNPFFKVEESTAKHSWAFYCASSDTDLFSSTNLSHKGVSSTNSTQFKYFGFLYK